MDKPIMEKRIVAAAMQVKDGGIYTLPRPYRHADIILRYSTLIGDLILKGTPITQGFLTSEGEFVNRDVALVIATKAGQLKHAAFGVTLNSTDVW